MNTMAHLDQHELGLIDTDDQLISYTRHAARAVLRNKDNQVAVMYFGVNGVYKLPGGGVDEGEGIINALHREIREETGYEIVNIRELGIVEENRYFCGMHQVSHCFTAEVAKFVGTDLTEKEREGGMELRWFDSIDHAITAIESGDKTDEDGSVVGLTMMKLRDNTILRAAIH